MSSKVRIGAGALAMIFAAGFATAASAQESITCQYFTAQTDPLAIQTVVTDAFEVDIFAAETNSNETMLKKATGTAAAILTPAGAIDAGIFNAEVDAKLKETSDNPLVVCADKAKVRGNGAVDLTDQIGANDEFVIRANSKLDGKKREGTLTTCSGIGQVGVGPCSIHKVNARLKLVGQGERNNGSLKYEKTNVNTKDLYEAVQGIRPSSTEDVVLVCECLQLVATP